MKSFLTFAANLLTLTAAVLAIVTGQSGVVLAVDTDETPVKGKK